MKAIAVHIKGLVQGVGFRPFVYRVALHHQITGWVENGNDGVRIFAEGSEEQLKAFLQDLREKAPPASEILEIFIELRSSKQSFDFKIIKSSDYSDEITDISPDIAVCPECLEDMKTQPHRAGYPFINCTNCGPRFTIIRGLPYDRPKTTMDVFEMCPLCREEYAEVSDRRFHAQPIACNQCGPRYELIIGNEKYYDIGHILEKTTELIHDGKIVAVKGMGGFHLACDATNEQAVQRLRSKKYREGKPFAVMFGSIDECRYFAEINKAEEELLTSWRRPIVILKNKQNGKRLAPSVSNGFNTTGMLLSYMPLHYLLFEKLATPAIVLTSGNLSDEPVIINNQEALTRLAAVADAFLIYNRDIYNRSDDSVMMVSGEKPRMIRRSRGFAPRPVNLSMDVDGIIATGAELVNCFCVGKGNKALLSQHIGDLKNLETLDFFEESLQRFTEMFRIRPRMLVCDLHPDYLSTRYAMDLAAKSSDLPLLQVQHHHAHIASCMAEHGLDEQVIGISMDGVGYGLDGNIWGLEILLCDLADFERRSHLEYALQPGSDMANHEPWRMGYSFLHQYVCHDPETLELPFLKDIGRGKIEVIKAALENRINTPLTSSAGRLFDAVAAITGVCTHSVFHAEAPMRLENILDLSEPGEYEFVFGQTISPALVFQRITEDILNKVPAEKISARFHRSVVTLIVQSAVNQRDVTGIEKVVLSGGSFQNRFLLSETENRLQQEGFQVYSHHWIPSNDGGVALGQLVIAAKKRATGCI